MFIKDRPFNTLDELVHHLTRNFHVFVDNTLVPAIEVRHNKFERVVMLLREKRLYIARKEKE